MKLVTIVGSFITFVTICLIATIVIMSVLIYKGCATVQEKGYEQFTVNLDISGHK